MIPMRTSSVFKSRWMALLWAAGIIWFAYDFVGPSGEPANNADNQVQITDDSGAPVSPDEAKKLEEAVKGL
jgi:hypothetical protein